MYLFFYLNCLYVFQRLQMARTKLRHRDTTRISVDISEFNQFKCIFGDCPVIPDIQPYFELPCPKHCCICAECFVKECIKTAGCYQIECPECNVSCKEYTSYIPIFNERRNSVTKRINQWQFGIPDPQKDPVRHFENFTNSTNIPFSNR
mgnify:CR=1 FL=1